MSLISFGGLGNGIDFQQVVNQLVAVHRLPINALTSQKKTLQTRLTDYGALGASLLKLQGAASGLRRALTFDRTSVAVSDSTIVTASGSSSAVPGNYTISVTQLAASHQVTNKAATAVGSTTTDIVAGGSATFSFRAGAGDLQTVNLGAAATLEDLKTAINDLGSGVYASILNAGTEASPAYRLVLTSATSGDGHAITITADTTTLDFLNGSGTGGMDTLQAAQDAIVVVGDPNANPVTIQRSSNTITDAISGVTLTLTGKNAEGASVNVSVSRDASSLKTDIKGLVTAYNDIVKFINARTTYDADSKQGGVFFGEATPKTVLQRLRAALSDEVDGLVGLTSASAVGFKTERDGTITVDDALLDKALNEQYTAAKNLFISQPGSAGIAQRLFDAVDALDDVEFGTLTLRKNRLTKEIADVSTQISRKEDVASQYEERLRLQYAALDSLLRQLQGQMDFIKSRL